MKKSKTTAESLNWPAGHFPIGQRVNVKNADGLANVGKIIHNSPELEEKARKARDAKLATFNRLKAELGL